MTWKVIFRCVLVFLCLVLGWQSWTAISVSKNWGEKADVLPPDDETFWYHEPVTAEAAPLPAPKWNEGTIVLLRTIAGEDVPLNNFEGECERLFAGEYRSSMEVSYSAALSTHAIGLLYERRDERNRDRRMRCKNALEWPQVHMIQVDPLDSDRSNLCQALLLVIKDSKDPYMPDDLSDIP